MVTYSGDSVYVSSFSSASLSSVDILSDLLGDVSVLGSGDLWW